MPDLDIEARYWEAKMAAADRLENPDEYLFDDEEFFEEEPIEEEAPVEYDDDADYRDVTADDLWDGRFDYPDETA